MFNRKFKLKKILQSVLYSISETITNFVGYESNADNFHIHMTGDQTFMCIAHSHCICTWKNEVEIMTINTMKWNKVDATLVNKDINALIQCIYWLVGWCWSWGIFSGVQLVNPPLPPPPLVSSVSAEKHILSYLSFSEIDIPWASHSLVPRSEQHFLRGRSYWRQA